jgi:hypothetical protein
MISEFWNRNFMDCVQVSAPVNGSLSIQPITLNANLIASRIDLFATIDATSTNNTSSAFLDHTIVAGIYTLSANTKLASVSTTTYGTSTYWQSNTTASVGGPRMISAPWNLTLTPGIYYLAVGISTTNTGTGANSTALANGMTFYGMQSRSSDMNSVPFNAVAFGNATGATVSDGMMRFFGVYSAATGSCPATIASGDMLQTGVNPLRAGIIARLRNI